MNNYILLCMLNNESLLLKNRQLTLNCQKLSLLAHIPIAYDCLCVNNKFNTKFHYKYIIHMIKFYFFTHFLGYIQPVNIITISI